MHLFKFIALPFLVSLVSSTPILPGDDEAGDDSVFVPLSSCGNSNDLLTIQELQLTPYPPKVGQTLSINATGLVKAPIVQGAKVHLLVKYRFLTLYDQTQDLCEISASNGVPCPIEPGQHNLITSFQIPGIAPKVYLEQAW